MVHVVGGCAALVGATIVGPRKNRFMSNGRVVIFSSTSVVLSCLGGAMLAFTWISFNGSSVMNTKNQSLEIAAHAIVNTMLCLSAAGFSSTALYVFLNRTHDLPQAINSMLGGLVAVTASCAFIDNWSAVLLGVVSGFVTRNSSSLLVRLRIDDPLDATSVHFSNGCLGTLWLGLLGRKDLLVLAGHKTDGGLLMGGGFDLFGSQLLGIIFCTAFTSAAITTACVLYYFSSLWWEKFTGGTSDVIAEDNDQDQNQDGADVDEERGGEGGAIFESESNNSTTATSVTNVAHLGLRDRIKLALR